MKPIVGKYLDKERDYCYITKVTKTKYYYRWDIWGGLTVETKAVN